MKSILLRIFVLIISITLVACDASNIKLDSKSQSQQSDTRETGIVKKEKESQTSNKDTSSKISATEKNNNDESAKIKEFLNNYLSKYNEAINNNDFSKVEEFYLEDSEAAFFHKDFLKSKNKNREKFTILNIDVKEVRPNANNPNQLSVCLIEKTSCKSSNKQEQISEDGFIFVLEKVDNKYKISYAKDWKKLEGSSKENTNNHSNEYEKTLTYINKWKFGIKDIFISNKPILDVTYKEISEIFGKQNQVRNFQVRPPSSLPNEYENMLVVAYKDIEFEFHPRSEMRSQPLDTDKVFRFDITKDSIKLDCGLNVGMTIDEVKNKFGDREIYLINESKETSELNNIKNVLRKYKPQNYYSGYSRAMIIYSDPQKFSGSLLSKALVLLIKDDTIDRIVFGYPTAG